MNLCDRIHNGMLFYEHGHTDPVDIQQELKLQEERDYCKEVMFEYNNTHPRDGKRRSTIMKSVLGSYGEHFFFEPPVHMSYGCHVHIGEDFYSNFNLVLVDDGEIFIGDKVMIGPNVTLCTTGHPVYPLYREMVAHYSLPIRIGNNVWIGAHSVVLPGVTIGDNAVIGAGSIVTRDVPANTVAFGNPCRVVREISDRDKKFYFRDLMVDYPYTLRQE